MKIILALGITALLLFTGCASNSASSSMYQSVKAYEATILQTNKDKNFCIKCGMKLPKFYKTNHAAIYNGEMRQYCSLHCLVSDLNTGNSLKNPKVVDLGSLKLISIADAHYVVGSRKRINFYTLYLG